MKQNDCPGMAEPIRAELVRLLVDFENELKQGDLRAKVQRLVPINALLRDLGSSLIPPEIASAARDRLLHYFREYPLQLLPRAELTIVAGIAEWARRVRELRVEFGWKIISGHTAQDMLKEEPDLSAQYPFLSEMGPDDYALLDKAQDIEAAYRWNVANEIRKTRASSKAKILRFLRENVGKQISGEELRYVTKDRSEWARRVRELRTEEGWPIETRTTGAPELPVGVYVLRADRQLPAHDRVIPDEVRCAVLERDEFRCRECGWSHDRWNASDPRNHLELHHVETHAEGGENTEDNLVTLCNVCHDVVHRRSEDS